jgi:DNA-binding CsgD family transcriptional regulator
LVYAYLPYRSRKKAESLRKNRYGKRLEKIVAIEKRRTQNVITHLEQDNLRLKSDLQAEILRLLTTPDKSPELTGFYSNFEKLYPKFTATLQATYPTITPNEINICAFLRLNITSKEISRLLNISPDSVNKARYRMRKKMNLDPKTDLTNHIINTSLLDN